MENYLVLCGWQLWICLALFFFCVFAFIALCRGYLDEVHKNYRLQRRLQNAKEDAAEWQRRFNQLSYVVKGVHQHDDE